jgi:hypothetical protein
MSEHTEFNLLVLCTPLHLDLPEDGDLVPKHVGRYKFIYYFNCYVHMLVYMHVYKHHAWSEYNQIPMW